jgi:hypothetical protein
MLKRVHFEKLTWREHMLEKRATRKAIERADRRRKRLRQHKEEACMAKHRLRSLTTQLNELRQSDGSGGRNGSKEDIPDSNETEDAKHADVGLDFGKYSLANAAISDPQSATGVQDIVEQWIAQGRDINVPLERGPPAPSQADNAGPPAKPEPRGGVRNFFKRLTTDFTTTGIIDSGATGNFLKRGIGKPTGRSSDKVVGMPNGKTEQATQQVLLPLTQLDKEARLGDELPSLHSNLISVPKLANSGYTTIFYPHDKGVEVYKANDVAVQTQAQPVVRGWRDPSGLWRIPLSPEAPPEEVDCCVTTISLPQQQINNLYHLPSVEARVAYIHACLGFPTKAAMIDAATAGRLVGIPFATPTNIRRFYPETKATPKGHLDQQRQGVRSTKAKAAGNEQEPSAGTDALTKEKDVHVQVWDLRRTTYSDQTGPFPLKSYHGN